MKYGNCSEIKSDDDAMVLDLTGLVREDAANPFKSMLESEFAMWFVICWLLFLVLSASTRKKERMKDSFDSFHFPPTQRVCHTPLN